MNTKGHSRPLAFGLYQFLQYIVAVGLVAASVHVNHGNLLLTAGCALALLALICKGPIALVRVVSPRVAGAFATLIAVALAAGPILPSLRPDITGIVVAEIVALGWLRITSLTRFTKKQAPKPQLDAVAMSSGRMAGRVAGKALRKFVDRGPGAKG